MTEKQEKLKAAHGTPAEFARACNKAADDLMITTAECEEGIEKYQREWDAAGDNIEVGTTEDGEVVINLPQNVSGPIILTPEEAMDVAARMWKNAEQLMRDRGQVIDGRNLLATCDPDKSLDEMHPVEQAHYMQNLARCIEMLLPPGPSATGRMMFLLMMFDRTKYVTYVANVERAGAANAMIQLLDQWRAEGGGLSPNQ